jgi:hypothetical protein
LFPSEYGQKKPHRLIAASKWLASLGKTVVSQEQLLLVQNDEWLQNGRRQRAGDKAHATRSVYPLFLLTTLSVCSWPRRFTAAVHSFIHLVQYSHSLYLILNMPSSSLILSVGTVLAALSSSAFATKYQQKESFTGKNWLDAFHFETQDFNNGFVNYVTEGVAKDTGLYKVVDGDVMFGVDAKETLDYTTGPGRKSVRLEGNTNYNKGLFILDVKTMPGMCGMWPSFWSLGEEPWPVKGEVGSNSFGTDTIEVGTVS